MVIVLNGEEKELAGPITLAELVEQVTERGERVAVELNREVVRRGHWNDRLVNDADRIEIVHFVGGG
jgi:thiamine biosynthesis protein ThiS